MSEATIPIKNSPYDFVVGLASSADTKVFKSSPTLAVGDVKISIDGGALSNLTNLPTASGKLVFVSLEAAETNGDSIAIVFSDQAGSEWCDLLIELKPSSITIGDIPGDVWEELTASHTTAGTTGLALLDASNCSFGSGSVIWDYYLTEPDLVTPIPDATVRVSTDIGGTNIVAEGVTDNFGKVTFNLDPGTYYIWCYKALYTFSNPDTEVVV